ncbi:MAG TPA: hypothetical protein VMF52_09565, partial [Steroidobacteraceae bacterium]|nr:hypothetical protein [Steroidobacteraceae bacterium]
LALIYLPILALLFVSVVAARLLHIPVASLTRDMAALAHVHPLIGVVSNVGILLWCATAAICLFGRNLLRQHGRDEEARFLLWGGVLTIVLLLDDLFMIHEYIAPVHFHVGEKVILACHACGAAAYLLSHRRLILAENYQLLVAAMVLFAASVLVDISDGHGWLSNLAEDGFKILGIASWLGYHAGKARHWLADAPPLRPSAPAPGDDHRQTAAFDQPLVSDPLATGLPRL